MTKYCRSDLCGMWIGRSDNIRPKPNQSLPFHTALVRLCSITTTTDNLPARLINESNKSAVYCNKSLKLICCVCMNCQLFKLVHKREERGSLRNKYKSWTDRRGYLWPVNGSITGCACGQSLSFVRTRSIPNWISALNQSPWCCSTLWRTRQRTVTSALV